MTAGLLAFLLPLGFVQTPQELALDGAVERELGAGESHYYSLPAAASEAEVLLLSAEQLGVDLALVRTSADGAELALVDSPSGRRGTEVLLLGSPWSPGERIEVRSLERKAPTARYRLVLTALLRTTVEEQRRFAAQTQEYQAARAYARGDAAGREEARAAYRAAAELWHGLGDRGAEARTLAASGHFARLAGDFDDALAAYSGALALWRSLGDRHETGWVLNDLGFVRAQQGDGDGARVAYEEAIALWEDLGVGAGLGRALNNLGLLLHTAGDPRAARPFYERALPLLTEAGYPALAATVRNNLAAVFDSTGEPEAAATAYAQAIATQRDLGNRREEARAEGNRATMDRALGHFQEALDGYRRALEIQRSTHEPAEEARTLSNLAETYLALGEPERALDLAEDSLALRRQAGDHRGEAYSLHNRGAAQRALGDLTAARASFEQAIELLQAAGDRRGEANSLRTLGQVLVAAGDREGARTRYDAALALQIELDDRRGWGETLRRRGELALLSGAADAARNDFTTALELTRQSHHALAELEALVGLGRAERAGARSAAAEADALEALARLESLRAAVAGSELRASFLALRAGAVELAVELAWDAHRRAPTAGHDRRAFELAHGARSRSLAEGIEDSPGRAAVLPELRNRRRVLAERLSLKTVRLADSGARVATGGETEALQQEVNAALAELESLDAEISRRQPRLTEWNRRRAATVAEVQALLPSRTLFLVYTLGTERSWLFALTGSSFASYELAPGAELEAAARDLHRRWRTFEASAPRGVDDPRAAALAGQLLGPVAAELAAAEHLVVSPDGSLGLLPFAALPSPDSKVPLITASTVSVVPSAEVLAALRARGERRPAAPERLLVVADPVFDGRDPRAPANRVGVPVGPDRLAWSGAEATAVARAWPAAEVRVVRGLEAGLGVLTAAPLDGYRIIHLATHGVVDSARSERTGLLFAGLDTDGRSRPSFLGLPEIHGLALSADLVVLSGCRTALGREVKNEGPIGLARGFLFAGAARVVASLWPVEDRATAELMAHFHQALASGEDSPATALAHAQRSLRAVPRWSDPYYWSGFILYGDGR